MPEREFYDENPTSLEPSYNAPDDFAQQLTALYAQYGRVPTAQDIEMHRGNPGGLAAVEQLLLADQGAPAPIHGPEDPIPPDPTPTPLPVDGTGGSGGTAATGGSLISPYTQPFIAPTPAPMPTAPTAGAVPTFGNTPTLGTPPPFAPTKFKAPSVEDALNDPGYKFRVQQGTDRLQNWAAARGTLNDSGTAKALIDYGQDAGSQEYQHVWDRDFNAWKSGFDTDLSTYGTNYGTQYLQPFDADYQTWMAGTVNPEMAGYNARNQFALAGYQTDSAATQHSNDMNYLNSWNRWLADWDVFKDQRDSTFNKKFSVANS